MGIYFLMALESGSAGSGCQHGRLLVGTWSWLAAFSLCAHPIRPEPHKAPIPPHEAPSHIGGQFQHVDLGDTIQSIEVGPHPHYKYTKIYCTLYPHVFFAVQLVKRFV